jgi:hypothetical protein
VDVPANPRPGREVDDHLDRLEGGSGRLLDVEPRLERGGRLHQGRAGRERDERGGRRQQHGCQGQRRDRKPAPD